MSTSVRERKQERGVELEAGVSWPAILTAVGLGVFALASGVGGALALRPAPQEPTPARVVPATNTATTTVWALPIPIPAPGPERVPAPAIERPAPPPLALATARKAPALFDLAGDAKAPSRLIVRRRQALDERELATALAATAHDVDLETEKGTTAKLLNDVPKSRSPLVDGDKEGDEKKRDAPYPAPEKQKILDLFAHRADLQGLPVRGDDKCRTDAKETAILHKVSGQLRLSLLTPKLFVGSKGDRSDVLDIGELLQREVLVRASIDHNRAREEWHTDAGVRLLAQMLQAEGAATGLQLIKNLADTKGTSASVALAGRAVFDLNPEVRDAAANALRKRPAAEYRSVLLAALRYPWPAAADHAAETLAALEDRDAVFSLVLLLDLPDPRAPVVTEDKKWMAPELVRVNHFGNCLLCHAASHSKGDPVRGLVPERDKSLAESYCSSEVNFVRADVTYLKPDFSALQTVAEPSKWSHVQRFDFLIRQRELSAEEADRAVKEAGNKPASYPQREAVLWALRELTGEDVGNRSEDWFDYAVDQWMMKQP